jgi:dipeptidyl aminopeptidase/acylaminoacyl peptidase
MPCAASRAADDGAIAPNENLITDGVPPVPAEIADTASRYGESRPAILSDWHPTQNQMLIRTRFGDTMQVHLVKTPGGARTQLTFFPDRVEGAQFDPIRGSYILLHKGVGGAEFFQNYRYDLNDGSITLLTDGKSRNSNPVFSHTGEQTAYTSTRRNGTDTDIYLEFPLDPKTDRLLAEVKGGGWDVLDWSPDGRKLLAMEYISVTETYLWLIDTSTGDKTALTPRGDGGEKVAYGHARFDHEGKGIFMTTDKGSEFQQLAYKPLNGDPIVYLTAGLNHDVDEFDLSEDGHHLAFVTNEDGLSGLYAVRDVEAVMERISGGLAEDPSFKGAAQEFLGRAERLLPAGPSVPANFSAGAPAGVVYGLKWTRNGAKLGINISGANVPGDCYSTDLAGNGFWRWTYGETGGLNPESFSQPKLIKWPSFDQKEVSGFLYAPDAQKFPGKRPVIVSIHGGPEGQYRPEFLGRFNYFISELGCALICPNVRGSTGYGKTFVSLDDGFKREDSYKDIDALLDWIKEQPGLDASRIMITGGSYGGHMTLAVSTFYADKIRCSVDVVGMSNLKTFLQHTESYRRDLRRAEYGDERDPKMAEFLDRIAPMNNAQRITKPIFIVQGYNDPRVPRSEAEQMVGALKKQGTPVWFLMARDEGHGFAKKKNADFQFYATVEFIRRFLLNAD